MVSVRWGPFIGDLGDVTLAREARVPNPPGGARRTARGAASSCGAMLAFSSIVACGPENALGETVAGIALECDSRGRSRVVDVSETIEGVRKQGWRPHTSVQRRGGRERDNRFGQSIETSKTLPKKFQGLEMRIHPDTLFEELDCLGKRSGLHLDSCLLIQFA